MCSWSTHMLHKSLDNLLHEELLLGQLLHILYVISHLFQVPVHQVTLTNSAWIWGGGCVRDVADISSNQRPGTQVLRWIACVQNNPSTKATSVRGPKLCSLKVSVIEGFHCMLYVRTCTTDSCTFVCLLALTHVQDEKVGDDAILFICNTYLLGLHGWLGGWIWLVYWCVAVHSILAIDMVLTIGHAILIIAYSTCTCVHVKKLRNQTLVMCTKS